MAASVAGAPEHWALDPAHESFSAQPVGWAYLRVWSWAHLDYVVRRCVVSSLGRKVTPAPPDPDAALQPDRTLFREVDNKWAVDRLVAELEANGPGTTRELLARLGYEHDPGRQNPIGYAVRASHGLIRVVGKRVTLDKRGHRQMTNVYGLACHEVETELHPAIAHLRDSGEWLTAGDLAAWAGIKPGSMAGIIQRYRSQLDAWPQEVHKAGRAYRVTYYRFKRGGQ